MNDNSAVIHGYRQCNHLSKLWRTIMLQQVIYRFSSESRLEVPFRLARLGAAYMVAQNDVRKWPIRCG